MTCDLPFEVDDDEAHRQGLFYLWVRPGSRDTFWGTTRQHWSCVCAGCLTAVIFNQCQFSMMERLILPAGELPLGAGAGNHLDDGGPPWFSDDA